MLQRFVYRLIVKIFPLSTSAINLQRTLPYFLQPLKRVATYKISTFFFDLILDFQFMPRNHVYIKYKPVDELGCALLSFKPG